MRRISDTHLHSNYSHDSSATLKEICDAALSRGLEVVCTTEHVFIDPRDVGYGYFDPTAYLAGVKEHQQLYEGKLQLLSGIELSEPNLYPETLKEMSQLPFDMIVGALHWMQPGFFGDPKVLASYPPEVLLENYYKDLLEVVNVGGFDTLAHFDLIKRYIAPKYMTIGTTTIEVLKSMVAQNIALEINTSTIRKDGLEPAPSYDIIDHYLALGGKRLTLGSDAHTHEDVGADFDAVPDKYIDSIGYFKQREFIYTQPTNYSVLNVSS